MGDGEMNLLRERMETKLNRFLPSQAGRHCLVKNYNITTNLLHEINHINGRAPSYMMSTYYPCRAITLFIDPSP